VANKSLQQIKLEKNSLDPHMLKTLQIDERQAKVLASVLSERKRGSIRKL